MSTETAIIDVPGDNHALDRSFGNQNQIVGRLGYVDFLDGVKYLQAEERKQSMPSLFDLEDLAGAAS